jgi:SAM-dependent methyltransferase
MRVADRKADLRLSNPVSRQVYDRLAALKLAHPLLSLVAECRCRMFDWRHHISTCGSASLAALTVQGANAQHGASYHPTHPKLIFEILDSLKIDHRDFIFVDLGSGKGRTLFAASEFPFQKVIGVEFADELHKIALKNARNYRSRTQVCKNIECLLMDASRFVIPTVPTVFFLYNPFGPPVLIPVLRNIEKSLSDAPREVLLVYVAAFHAQLIERETRMWQVGQGPYHKLYRFTPA